MSHKATYPSSSSMSSLDPQPEEFCPNYEEYDERARKESADRIHDHLQQRRGRISACVQVAVNDIKRLPLAVSSTLHFKDDDYILDDADKETEEQINRWPGVQLKQCKKQDKDGKRLKIDTFEKFVKKAKNHQDQTSWKISGDFFFAPYIKKARNFLSRYCESIEKISKAERAEIYDLACLSFANALFCGEIKFHRTKAKPLMRHRTLVKSTGIHIELEQLHRKLTVRTMIQQAKNKRKAEEGKTNIIAEDFFVEMKDYINAQYMEQKRKVWKYYDLKFDETNHNVTNLLLEDVKHSDIDDEDHDVDMEQKQQVEAEQESDSDSPSSIPPSVEDEEADSDNNHNHNHNRNQRSNNTTQRPSVIYDHEPHNKPKEKSKASRRCFQATSNTNIHRQKSSERKMREKQTRSNKIEQTIQRKLKASKTNPVHSAQSPMGYATDIKAVNFPDSELLECSDSHSINDARVLLPACNDDRTTISAVSTPTVSCTSVPSVRSPQRAYYGYAPPAMPAMPPSYPVLNTPRSTSRTSTKDKVCQLQHENASLQRQIAEMKQQMRSMERAIEQQRYQPPAVVYPMYVNVGAYQPRLMPPPPVRIPEFPARPRRVPIHSQLPPPRAHFEVPLYHHVPARAPQRVAPRVAVPPPADYYPRYVPQPALRGQENLNAIPPAVDHAFASNADVQMHNNGNQAQEMLLSDTRLAVADDANHANELSTSTNNNIDDNNSNNEADQLQDALDILQGDPLRADIGDSNSMRLESEDPFAMMQNPLQSAFVESRLNSPNPSPLFNSSFLREDSPRL